MNHDPEWREFTQLVHKRLEQGERDYKDKSFARSPLELLDEIEQEFLDIPGWIFVEWVRLRRIRTKIERLSKLISEHPGARIKL